MGAPLVPRKKTSEPRIKPMSSKPGRRLGTPDGMRSDEAAHEWRFARMYAKEVTKIMVDKGQLEDDPRVTKAFSAAVEVLESPMSQREKLAAARLILDFLKAKPVSKSEVTVQKAEDWLTAVTADALKDKDD